MRLGAAVVTLALLFLAGCASEGPRLLPEMPEKPPVAAPVGSVQLQRGSPRIDALDLAVVLFDQGLDAPAEEGATVFPTLRKAESILFPAALADTLRETGNWAAVRVVHEYTPTIPVAVEGEILRADGAVLELHIRVLSAAGERLLDRKYRDEAGDAEYAVTGGEDPFADMYRAIANDVSAVAADLDAARRSRLASISLLRFASMLSPGAFGSYIEESADGRVELLGLPAEDDSMLRRLQRLQRQHDLFIDTVDEQYGDLAASVGESYALWRQYSYELQRYGDAYRQSAAQRSSNARRGSYAAMQQVYASFRKVKIQEEDLRELVRGFSGESLDTVLEVDDGVVRLSGSVEERYAEWRALLARIFALETAVPGG